MKRSNVLQATRLGGVHIKYEYEVDTDIDNVSLKDTNLPERNIESHHGSPRAHA